MSAYAQDTFYLVKNNKVVAKYDVSELDYATFHLPEGVKDPSEPIVMNYEGVVGTYRGTQDGVSQFQLRFSTRPVMSEQLPLELLYLQFTGPAADYKDLHFFDGKYTLATSDTPEPFRFYKGVRQETSEGEAAAGSMVVARPDEATTNVTLVTGGSFDITREGTGYHIVGNLELEDGMTLKFDYTGACLIENESDEKDPAEEQPLPDSFMTGNVNVEPVDCYYAKYENLLADYPNLDYYYIMLYGDYNYSHCLDLGLVVDKTKYPDVQLPKGKYPILKRTSEVLGSCDFGALPAFIIVGEQAMADYGCWYTNENYQKSPLVAGEVEILENSETISATKMRINVKVTLYDNAAEPHEVTCVYNGQVEKL